MKKWFLLGAVLASLTVSGEAEVGTPVRHRLERGQTLAKMAKLYGVPVESVLSANAGLVPEHIPTGAVIVIPEPPQGWAVYKAQAGDSLAGLSRRYGIPVEETLALNPGLSTQSSLNGQDLRLPRASLEPAIEKPAEVSPDRQAVDASVAPEKTDAPAVKDSSALPFVRDLPGQWVEVRLPDGSRAWAPRANLLTYSRSPLPAPQVVEVAQRFRGVSYVWGGKTPNGVDCSGFVQQVFSMGGYRVPRVADEQFAATKPVTKEEAQPGDLVFFTTYLPGPSHVGIYLGNGRFVHASSSRGVTETGLDEPYFSSRYLGIRRIPEWATQPLKTTEAPVSQGEGPRANDDGSAPLWGR